MSWLVHHDPIRRPESCEGLLRPHVRQIKAPRMIEKEINHASLVIPRPPGWSDGPIITSCGADSEPQGSESPDGGDSASGGIVLFEFPPEFK